MSSLIRRAYNKIISKRISGELAHCGNGTVIASGVYVYNPQYINVGNDVLIGPDSRIEAWDSYEGDVFSPDIRLGNNVKINSRAHIGCINKVEIGDDCLLGSNVMIIDHDHGRSTIEDAMIHPTHRHLYSKGPVIIGKRCWLCENAVILSGVHIGDSVIVAAGSVVTKDVPSYCVVAGNPARIVKNIK